VNRIALPLELPNGVRLRNRIAKAAMSERLADRRGAPSEGIVRLYERWARGGSGLLLTGNVMVDRRHLGEPGNVVLEGERDLGSFRSWANAASFDGTRAFMQLNHPGRQAPRFNRDTPVAPSAVPMRGAFGLFRTPSPLTAREIESIIARFGVSAGLAKAAGFGGVQIHGAHGYLVSQFLSPLTNRREDGWGGTPDKRRRFLIALVRTIRSSVGREFPIAVKLNSADFQLGGFNEIESMAVVEALEAEGVDLLEISGGTYEAAAMFGAANSKAESTRKREAFFLEYAEKVRQRTRLPLMLTGGFRSAAGMNEALASGAVDLIGLGRPLALEPDLPARLIDGRATSARAVDLSTGLKKLDALLQGAFHTEQIRRLAGGLAPDAELGKLHVLARYLSGNRNQKRARPLHSQWTTVGFVPSGKSLQQTLS